MIRIIFFLIATMCILNSCEKENIDESYTSDNSIDTVYITPITHYTANLYYSVEELEIVDSIRLSYYYCKPDDSNDYRIHWNNKLQANYDENGISPEDKPENFFGFQFIVDDFDMIYSSGLEYLIYLEHDSDTLQFSSNYIPTNNQSNLSSFQFIDMDSEDHILGVKAYLETDLYDKDGTYHGQLNAEFEIERMTKVICE